MIATLVAISLSTISCSRQTPDQLSEAATATVTQKSGITLPESESLVLILGPDAQLRPVTEGSDTPVPAPFAIQTSVATVQAPIDGGFILAINRAGLLFLSIQDRQLSLRPILGAETEFSGRSVAQSWSRDGQALILLHRNEVFESETVRNPVGRIIAANAEQAQVWPSFDIKAIPTAQEDEALYGAPFAIFPRAVNSWLVQFRLIDQDRTKTAFARWQPASNSLEPLDRGSYEKLAQPAATSTIPPILKSVATALGGSMILDAALVDGTKASWLIGSVDSAVTVKAWVSSTTVVALASDGRLALADTEGIYRMSIDHPVPDTCFRDVAMHDGYIIAIWEEDLFPNIGRSGLVIMSSSLIKNEPPQP